MQAAPGPLLRPGAEAGAHRVVEDVIDGRAEVLVAVDDPRGVAVAEEVTAAFVAPVEGEGVSPVEDVHPPCHLLDRRLEDEVVVRRHQAVRIQLPVEVLDAVPEELQEARAIEPVPEDRALVDAERRDVEDAVRQRGAKDSRHASNVRGRQSSRPSRDREVTLSLRTTRRFPPTPRVRPTGLMEVAASCSAGP
jgi:hypothetical protein